MKSGFRKAGIVEKKQVITRLPIYDDNTELDDSGNPLIISQSFLDHLKKSRESSLDGDNKRVRRRKVNIEPGKSVTSADVAKIVSEKTSRQNSRKRLKQIHVVCQDATESETGIINKEIGGPKKLKTPEESQEELDTREVLEGLSETNREPSPDLDESGTESETSEFLIVPDDTGSESESENEDRSTITSSEHKVMMSKIKVGVYVIVNYEGELFPGIVSQSGKNKPISTGVIEVSTMKRVIGNS